MQILQTGLIFFKQCYVTPYISVSKHVLRPGQSIIWGWLCNKSESSRAPTKQGSRWGCFPDDLMDSRSAATSCGTQLTPSLHLIFTILMPLPDYFLWCDGNEKCSRVAEPAGHSGMEMAWCLSKCQIEYRCAALWPWATGWAGDSIRTDTHSQTHADRHLRRKVAAIDAESNPGRDGVRLGEANREIKTERQLKRTHETVNYCAGGLWRRVQVHSCVCVLALTHSCSVHITSNHMGNNEITKISLLEKENPLHFHAWCPVHVNTMRQGAKPTLFLCFFFSPSSIMLSFPAA